MGDGIPGKHFQHVGGHMSNRDVWAKAFTVVSMRKIG